MTHSISYETLTQHEYEQARASLTATSDIDTSDVYHAFAMMYGGSTHPRIPGRIVIENVHAEIGDMSGAGNRALNTLFTTSDENGVFMMSGDINAFGLWKPRPDSGLYFSGEQRIRPSLHGVEGIVRNMVARAVQGFLVHDDEYAKLHLGSYRMKPESRRTAGSIATRRFIAEPPVRQGAVTSPSRTRR